MARDRKRRSRRDKDELGDQLDALNQEGIESGVGPGRDPLDQGTPYVDEAKMAEAGADVPSPSDEEDDFDRAPDELESDPHSSAAGIAHDAHAHPRRQRGRFITFLGHCVDELRRVQWPDRRHVGQGTAVTLGFVVVAGAYLGLMDAIAKPLVEAIL